MKLLTGPIVGLVTQNSARILVETDQDLELECRIDDTSLKQKFSKCTPDVFQIQDLQRNRKYSYSILDPEGIVMYRASFTTLNCLLEFYHRETIIRQSPGSLKVPELGLISCNNISQPEHRDTSIWKKLSTQPPGLLIHCGDQVYADSAFTSAKKYLNNNYSEALRAGFNVAPQIRQEVMEIFRKVYRRTWSKKYTRKVLANNSNLMIGDDHEFTDDFGQNIPKGMEKLLGECAYQVYSEYQRLLWSDTKIPGDFAYLRLGRLGIIFTDAYYAKIHRNSHSYLGTEQLNWIRDRVQSSAGGANGASYTTTNSDISTVSTNAEIKRWVVITTQPVFLTMKWMSKLGEYIPQINDLAYRFNSPQHYQELHTFVDIFPQLPIFLTGDSHTGSICRLVRNQEISYQLISSGINNSLKFYEYLIIHAFFMLSSYLQEVSGIRYRSEFRTRECNMMLLKIHPLQNWIGVKIITESQTLEKILYLE